jgi:3-phenylpropionate/cinnamic acid dioxygenase small subunit
MTLSWEDHVTVSELIALHGHLIDAGELDRLDEVFTEDVAYDVSDYGFGILQGLTANREAALALGDRNPVGHHVTNVVLTEQGPDLVRARSKGIGIMADGTCGSVTYDDTVVRTERGWRISTRIVRARRAPLGR